MRDYKDVGLRLGGLCHKEGDEIAIMATIAQELFASFDGFDWVGFYRVVSPSMLKIGPYQGGHGCLVIPFEKGVCGAAARNRTIQLVDDVEKFEGHIACSTTTRSELVIPVFDRTGAVRAVLDIDSDQPAFFNQADATSLNKLMVTCFADAWPEACRP